MVTLFSVATIDQVNFKYFVTKQTCNCEPVNFRANARRSEPRRGRSWINNFWKPRAKNQLKLG